MSSFAPGTPIDVMNAVNQRLYGTPPLQQNPGFQQSTAATTGGFNPMTGMPFTQQEIQSRFGTPSTGGMGGLFSGALTNLAQTPAFQTLGQVAMGQPQQVPEWIQLAMQSGQMNNPYAQPAQAVTGGAGVYNPSKPIPPNYTPQIGPRPQGNVYLGNTLVGGQPTNQPMNLDQVLANLNAVNPGAINPGIVNPVRQPLPMPANATPVNLSQAIENVRRPKPSWNDRFNALRNRTKFSTGMR